MSYIFRGESILAFIKEFADDDKCSKVVATQKWLKGYKCIECGNLKYIIVKKHHSRECTKCRYIESSTANTLFHKVKFGLQKAFCIVFEMSCTTKGLSSTQMAKRVFAVELSMYLHLVRSLEWCFFTTTYFKLPHAIH